MDMEMMDMYRRPYSGMDIQAYSGEQQHAPHQKATLCYISSCNTEARIL